MTHRGATTGWQPTRRRLLALAGTGTLGALAGCGYRPGGGDLRWREQRGTGVFRVELALAGGNRVYGLNRDEQGYDFDAEEWRRGAHVTAYALGNGQGVWNRQLDSSGVAAAAGPGGTLSLGLADGRVVALGPGGDRRWSATVESPPRTLTAAADAVYACREGAVDALDGTGGGRVRWSASVEGWPTAVAGDAACATVGAESPDGRDATRVVAFDPDDGGRRWTVDGEWEGRAGLVAAGDALYGVERGQVVSLSVTDGRERWRFEDETTHPDLPLVAVGDTVYAAGDGLLSVTGGDLDWRHRVVPDGFDADPGGVYLALHGRLVALAPDGTERWAVDAGGVRGRPAVVGDSVVVNTGEGVAAYHRSPER